MSTEQCHGSCPTTFELNFCEIVFASRCISIDSSCLTTILLTFAVGSFKQYNFVNLRFTRHSIEC
jgi:hypothetical protein